MKTEQQSLFDFNYQPSNDISNLRCVPKSFSIALNGGKSQDTYYGLGEITDTYIEILKAKKTIREVANE